VRAKKPTTKKAATKKQPTPKAKQARARVNRVKHEQPPILGGEVEESDSISEMLGEDAAKRILILSTVYDYEIELDIVRIKGAINAFNNCVIPLYENIDKALKAETEPHQAAGRPSLYRPEWMLITVICLMAAGASKIELAAALGIGEWTLNQWCKSDSDLHKPVFATTVALGEALSAGWWEKVGRKNMMNKEFNYNGWYMNMQNRFGWKGKKELSGDKENPVHQEVSGHLTYESDWAAIRKRIDEVLSKR